MDKIFNNKISKDLRQKLRNNLSQPEIKLWYYLSNKKLGVKFRRQTSIGNFVVDFYSPISKLVIEIDGDSHFSTESKQSDVQRDKYLNGLGLKVLRFTNLDVSNNLEGVLSVISSYIKQ